MRPLRNNALAQTSRISQARVAERLEEIFTSAIDQIETALPSDPSGGRTNSVLPPLARAERYGPHDLGGLAALLAGCVGGQPPVGVSREHVFNALVACVREKDRCVRLRWRAPSRGVA